MFLQQVEGAWIPSDSRVSDIFGRVQGGARGLDTSVTGPGLACYTPGVRDRCAVLEFVPEGGAHVLARAYGVIELPRRGGPAEALAEFAGEAAAILDGFDTVLAYDRSEMVEKRRLSHTNGPGVDAHAAAAGEDRDGTLYDPLADTIGARPLTREIALFAVDGAATRVPLVFVLQR